MIKKIKVLLITFIILSGCINKTIKPKWIEKGFTQNQDHYYAVGIASWKGNIEDTFQAAKNNARAELAATIEVKIESVVESEFAEVLSNYDNKTYETLKKFTKSKVNQSLPETKVKEWWQDKKTKDVWVYDETQPVPAVGGITYLNVMNNNVDGAYFPRIDCCDNAGAAVFYDPLGAATTEVRDHYCMANPITILLAGIAAAGRTVTFWIYYSEYR